MGGPRRCLGGPGPAQRWQTAKQNYLIDEKDDVQFRAAACVIRLSVSPVAIPVKPAAATPSSAKP